MERKEDNEPEYNQELFQWMLAWLEIIMEKPENQQIVKRLQAMEQGRVEQNGNSPWYVGWVDAKSGEWTFVGPYSEAEGKIIRDLMLEQEMNAGLFMEIPDE